MTQRNIANVETRHITFDVEHRQKDGLIPVVISTDTPVEMADGTEILVHAQDAIDLQRAPLPIIATHERGQVNVGVVDKLRIENGTLRGLAEFGSREEARAYHSDVLKRIIRSVSIGYARIKASIRNDGTLITNRWMPLHVAMVAEPADINAGFFRDLAKVPDLEITESIDAEEADIDTTAAESASQESEDMAEQKAVAGENAEGKVKERAVITMDNETGKQMERARVSYLQKLGAKYGIESEIVGKWIDDDTGPNEAGNEVTKILAERSQKQSAETKLDLSKREKERYSMVRAINAVLNKNWNNAGLELECSREVQKRTGRMINEHTFFVPADVQQRDLIVGTATSGGYLVGTVNMSFIELLRNRSVVLRMGATRMSGLVGSVTVPKQTAPGTGYWLATEGTTATESQLVVGQLALSPKNVGAYTEISRQLLLQSSPSAEMLVMNDLAAVIGLAVDTASLTGTGTSEPLGIVNTNGIGGVTITTATITYANVLEFQADAAAGNALFGNSGYVTTPTVASKMMGKPRFTNSDTPIWQGSMLDGQVVGMRAMSSNQITAGQLLFGDFSQVVVGEWGVLEVEANPYANFAAGIVGVRAFYTVDVGVRYPAAFSLGTGITA